MTAPRKYTMSEAEIEALISRANQPLVERIQSLENTMRSGKGILIGAAAVIGFLASDLWIWVKKLIVGGIAS